jgi:hypothetical protein
MTDYRLCDAGKTLFSQVNARWPDRDHASDGWIGDASHAATASDHNPCWSCSGTHYGVVRAVDIDSSLGSAPGYNSTELSWRLANQLRIAMVNGDGRLSYIIAWNPEKGADFIASMNPAYQPLGVWRPYTGASHVNHIHVSFTAAGDNHGRKFECPVLEVKPTVPQRLKDRRDQLVALIEKSKLALADVLRRIRRARAS